LEQHHGVQAQVEPDGGVLGLRGGGHFQAAHAGGGAAEAGIAGGGVVVVQLAPADAALGAPLEEVVQVLLVGHFLHAPGAQGVVVQAPADVVVAAQVIQKDILFGQAVDAVQLLAQQAGVPGGYRVPGGAHGGHIVQKVALGFVYRAEVGDHLDRLHDHFAQQDDAGADDLADHPHHPHDGVDPGQVAAAGAQFLPDIGHRVDADDVHAAVGEVQKVVHHLVEHAGVGVVQIPLVGVEGGHDPAAVGQLGEVARRGGGEHLGAGLFVLGGDVVVVEEEVPAHVLAVAGQGPAGPLVVAAGVVHDKVSGDVQG